MNQVEVMKNNNSYERGASFCGRDEGCPSEAVFMWKEPKTGEQIVMMIEDSYGADTCVRRMMGPIRL